MVPLIVTWSGDGLTTTGEDFLTTRLIVSYVCSIDAQTLGGYWPLASVVYIVVGEAIQ